MAELATKKQLWALYCATKKDYRNSDITKEEASELLGELSKNRNNKSDYQKIYDKAYQAGKKAGEDKIPTPMVVAQHKNVLDDNSPVTKAWHVPEGVCGFASVRVLGYNGFVKWGREKGYIGKDKAYYGGSYIRIHCFGQSYERNKACAYAFARVLEENNIKCIAEARLD